MCLIVEVENYGLPWDPRRRTIQWHAEDFPGIEHKYNLLVAREARFRYLLSNHLHKLIAISGAALRKGSFTAKNRWRCKDGQGRPIETELKVVTDELNRTEFSTN